MRYFITPIVWSLASFIIAGVYHFSWSVFYSLFVLALLEIALSFDNTVVNAQVLKTMSAVWRRRFIVWGIPIAVFGIRFLLPIVIVWLVSSASFFQVWHWVFYDHVRYSQLLAQSFPLISGFGGAFLLMVTCDFFFSHPPAYSWVKALEEGAVVRALRKVPGQKWWCVLLVGIIFSVLQQHGLSFVMAYVLGMVLQGLLSALHHKLGEGLDISKVAVQGAIGFLYLELLDASFSLDGVIGAFTITDNIVLIMLGLGIGAVFVRSLTIMFVERDVLQKLRFLAHGAHYSIGFLAMMMLLKNFMPISEWVIGGVTLGIIFVAIISSMSN